MGLDTTHNCWHGPYSSFNRFRAAVATAAKDRYGYEPDYDAHPRRAFMGWWDPSYYEPPFDTDHHPLVEPLDAFFIHSDCDGWIFPHDAGRLAEALEPLIAITDAEWADRLQTFVAGLRDAVDEWEIIEFR